LHPLLVSSFIFVFLETLEDFGIFRGIGFHVVDDMSLRVDLPSCGTALALGVGGV